MRSSRRAAILVTSLCAGFAASAYAALGDDAQSIEADRVAMKAALKPATTAAGATAAYTVHQLDTSGGTTVREFVSAQGKVFAVAWSGPLMPNLEQLLGRYFPAFRSAQPTLRVRHRMVSIAEPDLVVESAGRPRAFSGRAYVPSLVPQSVRLDEIR